MNEESINDVSLVSNYEPQKKKRKTRAERKEALQEKKEKILSQLRKLQAQENAIERKKRNHRLIRIGAEVEKICCQELNDEKLIKFVAFLQKQKEGGWIDKAIG